MLSITINRLFLSVNSWKKVMCYALAATKARYFNEGVDFKRPSSLVFICFLESASWKKFWPVRRRCSNKFQSISIPIFPSLCIRQGSSLPNPLDTWESLWRTSPLATKSVSWLPPSAMTKTMPAWQAQSIGIWQTVFVERQQSPATCAQPARSIIGAQGGRTFIKTDQMPVHEGQHLGRGIKRLG